MQPIYTVSWRFNDSEQLHTFGMFETEQEALTEKDKLIADETRYWKEPGITVYVTEYRFVSVKTFKS